MPSIRPGESNSSCPNATPLTLRPRRVSRSVNQVRSSGRSARVVPTRPRIEIGPWTGMVRQIRHRPPLALERSNSSIDLALSAPDFFAPLSLDIADAVAFDVHRHQRLPSLGVNDVTKSQTHWLDQDDIESTLHRLLHLHSVLPHTSNSHPMRGPSRASHAIGFPSDLNSTRNAPVSNGPVPNRAVPNRAVPNRDVFNNTLHRSREHVSELLILHGFNVPLVFDAPTAERTARVSSRRRSSTVESPSVEAGIRLLRTGDGLAGTFVTPNLSMPARAAGAKTSHLERSDTATQNTVFLHGEPKPRLAFRVLPGRDWGSRQRLGRSSQQPKLPLPSLALRIRHFDPIVA